MFLLLTCGETGLAGAEIFKLCVDPASTGRRENTEQFAGLDWLGRSAEEERRDDITII